MKTNDRLKSHRAMFKLRKVNGQAGRQEWKGLFNSSRKERESFRMHSLRFLLLSSMCCCYMLVR